jgi:N-terminal acetyltransferase B complex non-catalytic subunit
MLRALIRVFQLASDFDDTVEEKLLIGDRPKQSTTADGNLPLRERLVQRNPAELAEVQLSYMLVAHY